MTAIHGGVYRRAMRKTAWTYGPELKAMREAKKLSQSAAAQAIGVEPLSYGNWERGKQNPSDESLKLIADAFDIDPRELGYEPPRNWELVPSEWIRVAFEQQAAQITTLAATLARIEGKL